MKSYLFNEHDLELLQFIKTKNPLRIWLNPIQYIFEYDGFYIEMEIYCAERFVFGIKRDINMYGKPLYEQYVMSVIFKKVDGIFPHKETATLLSENEPIKDIYIARTQLCSNEHLPTDNENHYHFTDYLKNPDIITTEPESQQSFIVDTGVIIELENRMLYCYIINNDDDFQSNVLDESYSLTHDFILHKDKYYKFIKI